jgi:hypothetical protein
MSKEKVFIVVSHINNLKKGSKTEWEVTETVEFVNHLKKKHLSMSTAIGDYLNRKMFKGASIGLDDYDKFEGYVRQKYGPQMKELDKAYRPVDLSVSPEGDQRPVAADKDGVLHAEAITVSD